MGRPVNPYAPPSADVAGEMQQGTVGREQRLVRMDRDGRLPTRCVVCNAPAEALRIERTLYWTPTAWRAAVAAVVVSLLVLSFAGVGVAAALFWPAVLLLIIANMVIRKKVTLDLGACARHRRQRAALRGAGIACSLGMIAALVGLFAGPGDLLGAGVLVLVVAMLVLGVVYSNVGVQAVRVARMTERHLWLKRAGKAFRDSLPEVAGAGPGATAS